MLRAWLKLSDPPKKHPYMFNDHPYAPTGTYMLLFFTYRDLSISLRNISFPRIIILDIEGISAQNPPYKYLK